MQKMSFHYLILPFHQCPNEFSISSPKLSGLAQNNFGPMKGKGIGRNFKIESFQMLSIISVISLHIAFCFKIR